MEYQTYQNNPYQRPVSNKRSRYMEIAAMVCGITAIVSCTCLYVSLILGALAIILGLLSRGGERTTGDRAIVGIALGGTGLGLTIILYLTCFMVVIQSYGGVGSFLDAYQEMSEMSYNEMYDDIYSHLQEQMDRMYPNSMNPYLYEKSTESR